MTGRSSPRPNGVPIGGLQGTRVLKAHTDAAQAAVGELLSKLGPEETTVSREAAEAVAAAVLTAEDGNRGPEYVIALRTPRNDLLVFGRYRTYRAAVKAHDHGLPFDGRSGIFPIVPFPKKEVRHA